MENEETLETTMVHHAMVAGHVIRMTVPRDYDLLACLPTFSPFVVQQAGEGEVVMDVELLEEVAPTITEERKVLTDVSVGWGNRFSLEQLKTGYLVSIKAAGGDEVWQMFANSDFSRLIIYVVKDELYGTTVLNWLMMMSYGQAVLGKKTMMIHASVVQRDGKAYAFLGKSGTGKSTHSRLWLQHLEGTTLLNDDNPVLRLKSDGRVWVYGTPWSGKTPCYINKGVELVAIVRLVQAQENRMNKINGLEAVMALMPSCTAMRWNRKLFNSMVDIAEKVVEEVLVGRLGCLPNAEAAKVCYEEINRYRDSSVEEDFNKVEYLPMKR